MVWMVVVGSWPDPNNTCRSAQLFGAYSQRRNRCVSCVVSQSARCPLTAGAGVEPAAAAPGWLACAAPGPDGPTINSTGPGPVAVMPNPSQPFQCPSDQLPEPIEVTLYPVGSQPNEARLISRLGRVAARRPGAAPGIPPPPP